MLAWTLLILSRICLQDYLIIIRTSNNCYYNDHFIVIRFVDLCLQEKSKLGIDDKSTGNENLETSTDEIK